ncbi:MAG: fructose-bisphosphatase class III [Parabacteroides merdae]
MSSTAASPQPTARRQALQVIPLVYHSRGFQLVQHEPFLSTDQAIKEAKDIRSTTIVVELNSHRQMVKDTDKGADLQQQIHDLEKLLYAFRNGFIKERERYK